MLQVQLAEAHASAAAAESWETAMSEALKEAEDRHVHQLRVAYLVTRAERRTLAAGRQDAPNLGRDPYPPARKKKNKCCSTAHTSTLGSVRCRTLNSSHLAIATRRCRLVALGCCTHSSSAFRRCSPYCTLAVVVVRSC